jgi:uncharacterized membrane protein YfcA
MWTADLITIAVATFLLAGLVKGVIGMGVPTVALALLTAIVGLKASMALLLLPALVTNIYQATTGGYAAAIFKRLSLFLACCFATVWLGVRVLADADISALTILLGLLLAVYAVASLARPQLSVGPSHERWLSPVIGALNGFLMGMTGSSVVPAVPYLEALRMPREMLVQAMGILFSLSTVALALSLGGERLLTTELAWLSALCAVPAVGGMLLGQQLRGKLSETGFRRTFLTALLVMGIYTAVSA